MLHEMMISTPDDSIAEKDQIRLVSIHSIDGHDELILSREHLRYLSRRSPNQEGQVDADNQDFDPLLDDVAESSYIALSYAWGKEIDQVQCDGADFCVSANLLPALSVIHRHFPGRFVWTDSLSIDQNDLGEKSYQVGIMGRIFSRAEVVVVWLGDDLDHLYDQLKLHAGQTTPDPNLRDSRIALLQTLAECAWFYRAWTFQEIRLATKAVVLLGEHVVPWDEFIGTVLKVRSFEPNVSTSTVRSLPMSHSKFRSVKEDRFFAMLNELNSKARCDLASLLFLTWYRAATEKCDKVYSLLSDELIANRHGIMIDYNVPWSTLCIKSARAAMNTGGNLKILRIAGMTLRWKAPMSNSWDRNELRQLLNHPSWVPDWWYPPQQPRSYASLEHDQRGVFQSLDFCCPLKPSLQSMEDDSPFLVLSGVFLGLINTSHEPTYNGGATLVHPPPPCTNMTHDSITNDTDHELTIPKVGMRYFSKAIDEHVQGKCHCQMLQRRMPQPPQPSFSRPFTEQKLYFSNERFHLQSFAPDEHLSEDQQPAQVLADSVESGDWLVLLEGGGIPFVLRPAKDVHGRLPTSQEYSSLAHGGSLPLEAGVFVLVGEASMQWDKIWPRMWERYCRAGQFIIV